MHFIFTQRNLLFLQPFFFWSKQNRPYFEGIVVFGAQAGCIIAKVH
jgi:hypothetical protein